MLQFSRLAEIPTVGECITPLAERMEAHQRWILDVREPAEKAADVRTLEVAGAEAEYTIARIADASWAVKIACAYTCGNYSGVSAPWDEKNTRQACVDAFLALARSHFGQTLQPSVSERQKEARRQMLALLDGGLFFIEPPAKRR